MNSQVLIDRELLAEYLSGHGEDWVEAGHKLREILDATPAPIPDAVEVVDDAVDVVGLVHSLISGKTVSVDVSTGDDDAGNRIFATVYEVQEDVDGFVILCDDPHRNYPNVSALVPDGWKQWGVGDTVRYLGSGEQYEDCHAAMTIGGDYLVNEAPDEYQSMVVLDDDGDEISVLVGEFKHIAAAPSLYDHSEDVRTMVVPDIARFEKHAMKAKDCLSECDVVLLSSIRRLLASPAPSAVVMPAVPDGYKVVPIEPTKEMMDAALMADCGEIDPRSIVIADYRAMLAAAPAAPTARRDQGVPSAKP